MSENKMREDIKWLIDRYIHEHDEVMTDINNFGGAFRSGVAQTYDKVIDDLENLLEDK